MERWRARIDAAPDKLARIVQGLEKLDRDYALLGGAYKKPKGDPGRGLFDWYNAKRIVFGKTVWFEPDPPGPELMDTLTEAFSGMMPLYRYLAETI